MSSTDLPSFSALESGGLLDSQTTDSQAIRNIIGEEHPVRNKPESNTQDTKNEDLKMYGDSPGGRSPLYDPNNGESFAIVRYWAPFHTGSDLPTTQGSPSPALTIHIVAPVFRYDSPPLASPPVRPNTEFICRTRIFATAAELTRIQEDCTIWEQINRAVLEACCDRRRDKIAHDKCIRRLEVDRDMVLRILHYPANVPE